jgi:N-acetylmuramoyl-L-alanine amidase
VQLYRIGDSGEPVRDIQDRLNALGFPHTPDEPGTFGEGTDRAVREFQETWKLPVDGVVGRDTWSALVDAGFKLGDRLLYYRLPMLHGDDVARLQHSLNALGFDAGNVDGIFGPDTLRAVLEFQQNRQMAEDGIAGPDLIREFDLVERATQKPGRDVVRERVWLSTRPGTTSGLRVFLDPASRDEDEAAATWKAVTGAERVLRNRGATPLVSRSVDTRPSDQLRATRANESAADLVLSFAVARSEEPAILYFASAISHSEAGSSLAEFLAGRLGVPAVGRVTPILRFTRAPAIQVSMQQVDDALGRTVVRSVEDWMQTREDDASG